MCWAYQPTDALRDKAVGYLEGIMAKNSIQLDVDTRLVSMHIRRDDYMNCKN